MRIIVAIALLLLIGANVFAQDKENEAVIAALQKLGVQALKPDFNALDKSMRLQSIQNQVFNHGDVEAWRKIKTKADWEGLRDQRIANLRESLGHFPEAPKEVKVVTTKKLPGEGFSVENIIYESRPGLFVTANLYVPEKTDKPMPGFIIIHSHHNPKTQGELQDMGMNWARQGCLVLVPDMLGHGERRQHPFATAASFPEKFAVTRQDYHFRYNTALQLHLVGESLMGWMVWDLMRGLDVLYQRPNLDKSKIVVFGSVAGGGDPCAVFAALDPRVTAAAPFNFGGPQPETRFPLPADAEFAFNYMGGGSWESTRGLRMSAQGGFLPWVIVGSIAPRGLIYSHEFAWDDKNDPVWARFNKIWGFYDAKDKLASAKGRGSVQGMPPEATHCNNIGPEHRKPIYPTLNKWFGLPVPEKEYKKRFDASELQCWTHEARKTLKPKLVHELAREIAANWRAKELQFARKNDHQLKLLGIGELAKLKIQVETVGTDEAGKGYRVRKQIYLRLPVMMLIPDGAKKETPVVIALAQDGNTGFLKHRAETIAILLKNGVAVCLPELRGSSGTSEEGRGRQSRSTRYSATELMHGRTVAGTQLQELVMLMRELPNQGFGSIVLWGDSFAEPNDPKTNIAVPLDVSKMPRLSEPMGGYLALLGGLFGDDKLKAIYVRGGLVSFRSMLDSPFCWFPHDAVIPGVLTAYPGMTKNYDIDGLVEANGKRDLRMESLVDGVNRRVDAKAMANAGLNPMIAREQASSPAEVAAWLTKNLKK